MSEPDPAALRERLAELRGEHGWARHVEDEVLVAWLGSVRRPDPGPGAGPEDPARR